jgi:hypothetical protein
MVWRRESATLKPLGTNLVGAISPGILASRPLASRDGDQFRLHRAARQALTLPCPATDLKAITVEGVLSDGTASTDGEEVIDLV